MRYLFLIIIVLFGCQTQNESIVMDSDGNSYQTKAYGNSIWMTENLRVTKSNLGESIQYFYPNNDSTNLQAFGLLYDYETACKVCPKGWGLPTNDDWENLLNYHESRATSPYKDSQYWTGENNINSTQFSARPAGFGNSGEHPNQFNIKTLFWSHTSENKEFIWTYILELGSDSVRLASQHPTYAFSVRCIKSEE